MKLPVYLYGHPVLRKISEPVAPGTEGLNELVAQMFDAMYESEGVGLAAPQIGKNIRLVVIDADPVAENFPECAGRKFALINPVVEVLDGDPVSRPEGCLSLPGISENVPRVEHIRLTWLDENFKNTPRKSAASWHESCSTNAITSKARCSSTIFPVYASNLSVQS